MAMNSDENTLLNEIKQGKELAYQLKKHLNTYSQENCEFLLEKLLSSYEKSLSILNFNDVIEQESQFDSPRTEKNVHKYQCRKDIAKKRKVKKSKQVQVCLVQKDQLEDGFTWRKYGQKIILGANYPRSYYRCSYRHTQGCLATKQVQKSDEEFTTFEVKYRGIHTCSQINLPQQNSIEIQQQQQNYQNTLATEHISPFGFQVENQVFSPWQMNCFGMLNHNSDLTAVISAPTSLANSSVDDFDFSVDQVDFGDNFQFNIHEIFS